MNPENFELNIRIFRMINENNTAFLDNFFMFARYLGRGELIIIFLLFLLYRKDFGNFRHLFISSVITAFFVVLIKFIVDAPRPALFLEDVHLLLPYYRKSFPSGDSAVASLILIFFFWKVKVILRILLVIYWLIICYGRIYLGVHFPLDIAAGFLIALFSVWTASVMLKKVTQLFNCNDSKKLV
ncbi:MAG: phosphatase PAP2 family protein [Deltaproteobacteria bacterium]|nr:phosphatase PAP2 family protein [Deltaproteobacteria bacterium]